MDLTPLFNLPAMAPSATDASDEDTNVAAIAVLAVSGMVLMSSAAYLKLKLLWARQQGGGLWSKQPAKGSSRLGCTPAAASAVGQAQLLIDFDSDGGRFITRELTPADNLSTTREELQVSLKYVLFVHHT